MREPPKQKTHTQFSAEKCMSLIYIKDTPRIAPVLTKVSRTYLCGITPSYCHIYYHNR